MGERLRTAAADFGEAMRDSRLWLGLGWADIKRQYRRSFLGPVWMTASAAIFVGAFSMIGAGVFNSDAARYVPYLAMGYVVFSFITATLNESCHAYITSEHLLRQVPMSKLIPPLRCFHKNLLVLAHNLVVPVVVVLAFGFRPTWAWLSLLPMLLLIAWFALTMGLFLAIANLRYRDTAMIVSNTLMILFFVTPVFWPEENLGGRSALVVQLNPVAAMLRSIRQPVLDGTLPGADTYLLIALSVAVSTLLAAMAFITARRRIVYWL